MAGNQPEGTEGVLKGLGLSLDLVASSARWGVSKPDPRFFRKISDELHLPVGSIAYVGDRFDNDVLPAQEAGMLAVFIRRGSWGYIHAEREDVGRADLRIDTLSSLAPLLAPRRRQRTG